MKNSIFILIIFAIVSCNVTQPEAQVTLVSWSQLFDVNTNMYTAAEVHYRIENISSSGIDTYTIYATVTCDDESEYEESTFGYDLAPGESKEAFFYIDTDGKKATKVEITNWEVKKW